MRSSFGSKDREFLDGSALFLAPMAGYTSAPFRFICFEFGADFAVTEMVSPSALTISVTAKTASSSERISP